jgi:hypothetical protein
MQRTAVARAVDCRAGGRIRDRRLSPGGRMSRMCSDRVIEPRKVPTTAATRNRRSSAIHPGARDDTATLKLFHYRAG